MNETATHDEMTQARAQANREELARFIARTAPPNGTVEAVKGLHLSQLTAPRERVHGVAVPSFCVIAQGSKEIYLGDKGYRYDPYHYLLGIVELPVVIQHVEASPEKPYLGLRFDLDPALVASVMLEAALPSPLGREATIARAIDVSPLDNELLDIAVRLVRLANASPTEVRVLLPLVTRELLFRLLVGAQGARLRQIAVLGGHTDRIARAIERLRNEYDKPLRVEQLARDLGMSASGFHEHFKAVTATSPLQFQKQLRLQEARRLLLGEDMDAATVAYRVGYEDPSQFSREYKRLFGNPPLRDTERLRAAATVGASPLA